MHIFVTLYVFENELFCERDWAILEKDSWRAERQNRKLSEGVSPSFCDLVEPFMNPKIAHRSKQNGSFLKSLNSYIFLNTFAFDRAGQFAILSACHAPIWKLEAPDIIAIWIRSASGGTTGGFYPVKCRFLLAFQYQISWASLFEKKQPVPKLQ